MADLIKTKYHDSEIAKSSDFQHTADRGGLENLAAFMDAEFSGLTRDMVVEGLSVTPTSPASMNVRLSMGLGWASSAKKILHSGAEIIVSVPAADPVQDRIDTLEVQYFEQDIDVEIRAFKDPGTGTLTYVAVPTKTKAFIDARVITGLPGAGVAPNRTAGWTKLAEITVLAGVAGITSARIKPVVAELHGEVNAGWTAEADATFRLNSPASIKSILLAHTRATTGVHGATSAGTQNALMIRDANGRAQVAAPSAADDIAIKQTVDDHAALTSPHSSTSAATASSLMLRDADGRSKVAAPAAADDIARKAEADAVQTNLNSHSGETAAGTHGSTVAATANRAVHRDANGRAQIAAPSADADIANRGWVRDYCIPIGMVYVQGPADAAPSTLWPGTTWTNVSSEEAGLFRRFEGGAALAFGGGTQSSQNRAHNHGGASGGMSANNPHSHTIPAITAYGTGQICGGSGLPANTTHTSNSTDIAHTHSISSDGGTEARPDNVTVRKWRRTA